MAHNERTDDYHNFNHYQSQPRGVLVPQRVYRPQAGQHHSALPPIQFTVRGQLGLCLGSALNLPISELDNAGATFALVEENGTRRGNNRHTIRILWPGYEPWQFENGLYTTNSGGRNRTLSEIAHEVAGRVWRFYEDMDQVEGTENGWQLQGIPFDKLYIVELRNVSKGSWQPVISYRID